MINVSNKEIIAKLAGLGISVKSHMSKVDDAALKKLEYIFGKKVSVAVKKKAAPAKAKKTAAAKKDPKTKEKPTAAKPAKKVTEKAPAKKAVAKKAVAKKAVAKKAVAKKAPAKKKSAQKAPAKKTVAKKAISAKTVLDNVLGVIKRSKKGATIATLKEKTKLEAKQLSNALYKLTTKGVIATKLRGLYVAK